MEIDNHQFSATLDKTPKMCYIQRYHLNKPEVGVCAGGNTAHTHPKLQLFREQMNDESVQGARDPQGRGSRAEEKPLLGLARVLALIGGLSAAVMGVLLGGLFAIGGLLQGEEQAVVVVTLSVSLVAIGVGPGLAVAWQALQAMQGRPSPVFRPPRAWPLAALFVLAVAVGQLILSLDVLAAATFPPFHVLAATLPPLTIVTLAGRALAGSSRRRDMVLQLGAGALISTPLALVLEGTLIVGLALLATLGVALRPGGPELLERLSEVLQTAPPLEDPEALMPLLLSPAIIAGAAAIVAGAVPLIEEAVKTAGVPLLAYRRPGMAQALLWGLAGGAGFAIVEGLLNTTAGLQGWALTALVRVGATLLHCLTGALMGLAWYHGIGRKHWGRTLGLYAGSVGLHGFWNLLSVGLAFLSLSATSGEARSPAPILSGLSMGLMAALACTALVTALGLAGLIYHVRRQAAGAGGTGDGNSAEAKARAATRDQEVSSQ